MRVIADLHIHSRYSRATSKEININNLEKYAKLKGLSLLGTGDFTHPEWVKELKSELIEDGSGILKTNSDFAFVLQTEISLVYTQEGKGRRIHNVVFAPSFEIVGQITEYLLKHGRLDYDGRPIFKIPCPDFVYELKKISDNIEIIPAHIWTPWFSLFGSESGFDSVKDCFKDQTKGIFALETGLSSDPAMNWRLSQLDRYSLVSCSDSHSFWPWRMGREATIFNIDLSYKSLINALRTKKGLEETIEVVPSYGKYHFDGHRICKVCLDPKESIKLKDLCPKCGRKLTIGVAHRVEELADRGEGFKPKDAKPFYSLIPLSEIISTLKGFGIAAQKTWKVYHDLINEFGSEFNVLIEAEFENLKKVIDERLAKAVIDNREGKIDIKPGFDGVYGEPIFSDVDKEQGKKYLVEKVKPAQRGLNQYF